MLPACSNESENAGMTPTDLNTLEYAAGALVHDPESASDKIRQYVHWIERFYPKTDSGQSQGDLLKALNRFQEIRARSRVELLDAVSSWQNSDNSFERNAYVALLSALLDKITEDMLDGGSMNQENQILMERIARETKKEEGYSPTSTQKTAADKRSGGQGFNTATQT